MTRLRDVGIKRNLGSRELFDRLLVLSLSSSLCLFLFRTHMRMHTSLTSSSPSFSSFRLGYFRPVLFCPNRYGILSSEALAQFPNLKVLNIATTAVAMDVSQVLSATCNMPHLEVLRLEGNELRGSIPPCLDGLRDLRVLNVGGSVLNTRTSISGKVPGMLGKRCVSTKSDHINCRFCPNAQLDWCQ